MPLLLMAALLATAAAATAPQCAAGIRTCGSGPAQYNCSGAWCNPDFSVPTGSTAGRCDQFPRFPPDKPLDCALRELMFEFGATTILQKGDGAGQRNLWDGLELGPRCAAPPPPGLGPPPTPTGFRPSGRGVGVAGACGAATRTFHVRPNGSDTAAGSQAAPFGSLGRAREAVRSQPLEHREPTCVVLHAGLYELRRSFRLTVEDGGRSPEAPVVYTAAAGERVINSGGEQLPAALAWHQAAGLPAGVLATDLPAGLGKSGTEEISSLFADGRRQVRQQASYSACAVRGPALNVMALLVTTLTVGRCLHGGQTRTQSTRSGPSAWRPATGGLIRPSPRPQPATASRSTLGPAVTARRRAACGILMSSASAGPSWAGPTLVIPPHTHTLVSPPNPRPGYSRGGVCVCVCVWGGQLSRCGVVIRPVRAGSLLQREPRRWLALGRCVRLNDHGHDGRRGELAAARPRCQRECQQQQWQRWQRWQPAAGVLEPTGRRGGSPHHDGPAGMGQL